MPGAGTDASVTHKPKSNVVVRVRILIFVNGSHPSVHSELTRLHSLCLQLRAPVMPSRLNFS